MAALNKQKARVTFIDACAAHAARLLSDDPDFRLEVALQGFAGFAAMPEAGLDEAAVDAGLDEHDWVVGVSVDLLRKAGAA